MDETKIPELAKKAVKANPYSVLTLTFLKLAFGKGQTDDEIISRPDYRFLLKKIRDEMAHIANTNKIAGVMVKGNWMLKNENQEILDEIAPKFQSVFDKSVNITK